MNSLAHYALKLGQTYHNHLLSYITTQHHRGVSPLQMALCASLKLQSIHYMPQRRYLAVLYIHNHILHQQRLPVVASILLLLQIARSRLFSQPTHFQ